MVQNTESGPAPIAFDLIVNMATHTLLQDGYHAPTLIVDGTHKQLMAQILDLAPTHAGRASQMFSLGLNVSLKESIGRLRRVFLITEGWMVFAKNGTLPPMSPSQSPDRREAMVITSYDVRADLISSAVFELIRDEEGQLDELVDLEMEQDWTEPTISECPLLEAFIDGYNKKENPDG